MHLWYVQGCSMSCVNEMTRAIQGSYLHAWSTLREAPSLYVTTITCTPSVTNKHQHQLPPVLSILSRRESPLTALFLRYTSAHATLPSSREAQAQSQCTEVNEARGMKQSLVNALTSTSSAASGHRDDRDSFIHEVSQLLNRDPFEPLATHNPALLPSLGSEANRRPHT